MEEIILIDEIIDENENRNKSQHRHHHKTKAKKNKYSHSKSEKKIYKVETHKIHKKNNKSDKILKDNNGMYIAINYVNNSNNDKIANSAVNKNKIKPLSSISSNFSNIKKSEPLNLLINKNDSVIHSIVNEMGIKN